MQASMDLFSQTPSDVNTTADKKKKEERKKTSKPTNPKDKGLVDKVSTPTDKKVAKQEATPVVAKAQGSPIVPEQPAESVVPAKPPKVVPHEHAMEATTEYFEGDAFAASVWVNKYALKNTNSELLESNPNEMHHRIAGEIARIEKRYPNPLSEAQVFELIKDFKYIVPQGSPMAGIGNPHQISSLSNCFVIGTNGESDSYGAVMKIDEQQVQLMKRRGGVGHDLSHIRPRGSKVNNSALTSTGVVPFMERYSNSTREVAQDGRRGALMLSISIKHPDSNDFIDAKMTKGKVTGANVSVKIDDDFMRSVVEKKPYVQTYPVGAKNPVVRKEVDSKELWDKIIFNAWKSAEPGILFWDTVLRESVPDCYADLGFGTVSTNPCGEIPLCPYDSCRLLAINLYSYVDKPFSKEASFNFTLFKQHVHYAQRMMDDIIDLELEKVDKILAKIDSDPEADTIKRTEKELWLNIKEKAMQGRRTGIGITAEGDMLAALGLRYGSDEATDFSVQVHRTLAIEAYRSSVAMAAERGAFEIFDYEREAHNPMIQRIGQHAPEVIEEMKKHGRRNIALLTIAPTGSVSICTQTSSGIEPAFNLYYLRRKKVNPNDKNARVDFVDEVGDSWEETYIFHHKFVDWYVTQGGTKAELMTKKEEELEALAKQSPFHNATAQDIDWVNKVKMQGAIQKWVDHSISVTVNVPENTTVSTVEDIYKTAWESGCKGITIYREGSRSGVLVTKSKDTTVFKETTAPKRPQSLKCNILRFKNMHEDWIAFVGVLDGRPYEVFTGLNEDFLVPTWITEGEIHKVKEQGNTRYDFSYIDKQGFATIKQGLSRSFNTEFWNYAKLISGILRHGMPLTSVIDIVEKLQVEQDFISTWKKGVVRALSPFVANGMATSKMCPDCLKKSEENKLVFSDGCNVCPVCGYSKCS